MYNELNQYGIVTAPSLPYIALGRKNSDTSPLVLSFSALVSDTLAIRHEVWHDLQELLLRCGPLSTETLSVEGRMNQGPALMAGTCTVFQPRVSDQIPALLCWYWKEI